MHLTIAEHGDNSGDVVATHTVRAFRFIRPDGTADMRAIYDRACQLMALDGLSWTQAFRQALHEGREERDAFNAAKD